MATVSWLNAVSGDFADASNWSTDTVPKASDIVQIKNVGTFTVTSSTNENFAALTMASYAALDITRGAFDVEGSFVVSATNKIDIGNGAALDVGLNPLSTLPAVNGVINVAPGGTFIFRGATDISGNGIVNLGGVGSVIDVAGASNNSTHTLDTTVKGTGTVNVIKKGGGLGAIDCDSSASNIAIVGDGTNLGVHINEISVTGGGSISTSDLVNSNGYGFSLNGSFGSLICTGANSRMTLDNTSLVFFNSTVANGGLLQLNDNSLIDGPLDILSGGVVQFDDSFSSSYPIVVGDGGLLRFQNNSTISSQITTLGDGLVEFVSGTNAFYSYNDHALVQVDNGVTLKVGRIVNNGNLEVQSTGDMTTLDFVGPAYLFGSGSITLSDNAANRIEIVGTPHRLNELMNNGNTISGAGEIGGIDVVGIANRGVIDATGTNALIIDLVSDHVNNGVHGVMEASGPGGLSVVQGIFLNNGGTVIALDGSSVTFGSGATITNDVAGKLAGGRWLVTSTGDGATMTLSGQTIATLAAKVVLSGAGSVMETGGGMLLEAGLTTIAAGGTLELLAGRGWTSTQALTDDAQLQLSGGTFAAAGLTVGATGTVSAVGIIASPTVDNGLILANRGALAITGAVTGTGVLKLIGGSSLTIGGALASSVDVLFGNGTRETLKLAYPAAFASNLTNWSYGDTIDLLATDTTSAQISGNTLVINLFGGGTLDYSLANPSAGRLVLASDGHGGTNITLNRSASAPALLTQAMAGMASTAPVAVPESAVVAPAPLAMIGASRA